MTGEEVKVSGIERFDGTDYGYWRMQIADYLYGKKLHLPLLRKRPDSEVIHLTLSKSVAHNVIKEKTTADLMTALSGSQVHIASQTE